jgi:dTDP-glucose 4,6-dehydratase
MTRELLIVTGGAGFIGSVLVEFVQQESNLDVWVIDSLTYASDKSRIPVSKNIKLLKKSISNFRDMEKIFIQAKSRYDEINVIHLAAESHVDRSIKSGALFIETNVLGTQNLLELSSRMGIKRFVHVSTDEVYGEVITGESIESDNLNPSSAYAASKAASDLLVLAQVRTHGLDAVITRCTNNFGAHQAPEKFVPRAVNRLMQSQPVPVYGNGEQMREWISVADHVRGIWSAFQYGKCGEIYNLGSGWRKTNIELLSFISKVLNVKLSLDFVSDRLGHDTRYAVNSNKSREQLGWSASDLVEESFSSTIKELADISLSAKGRKRFGKMEMFYAN